MDSNCEKCVQYPGEKYTCPAWIRPENGFMETNPQTGDERLVQGCFYQVIPKLMVHVVQASNRPAASMDALRGEINSMLTLPMVKALTTEDKTKRMIGG